MGLLTDGRDSVKPASQAASQPIGAAKLVATAATATVKQPHGDTSDSMPAHLQLAYDS